MGLILPQWREGTMRLNLRCAEHVTPAFSVRDSEAVRTVTSDRVRRACFRNASRWVFFCCHALFVAWRPWPLQRVLLLRHGFVGIALLIRRTAERSGYTCLEVSLSHRSIIVELEVVLYSDAGEACTIIDTSREPLPVCVALTRIRMQKHEWLLIRFSFAQHLPLRTSCARAAARCS